MSDISREKMKAMLIMEKIRWKNELVREWLTARDVAKKYEALFHETVEIYCLIHLTITPRATDHIAEQIAMVKQLEEQMIYLYYRRWWHLYGYK
jgi:cysteinyl-tRNA synthetase